MFDETIGVLMGGDSAEREISLRSGSAVSAALREKGYRVKEFTQMDHIISDLERFNIKLVFIALHGCFGEDGTIQKKLDDAGIAYTGSGFEESARAFNKVNAKSFFQRHLVPTPLWAIASDRGRTITIYPDGQQENIDYQYLRNYIHMPVAIKPINEGSSIGVRKVQTFEELESILQSEDRYPELMIEEWIGGRELTVGILSKQALPIIEIKTPRSFYDFEAKYVSTDTQYCVLNDLPENISNRVQKHALEAHNALGCRDMSRVDIMLDSSGHDWVLEINTIPGFTNKSLFPKAAAAVGIVFNDLCERILLLAAERKLHIGKAHI
ncbi:MAG: D-alanine--D-alanine ligase [Chlamydiota bacterium]|nr:D-alanine--D-alanine ligase [Chlamydiota bacterium]